MMDKLFASILDMTLTGSLVILVVLLARLLLRRSPRVISYGLWLVVLLRLLCPVQIQSPVSVLPEISPVAQNYALGDADVSFADASAAAMQAAGNLVAGDTVVQQLPVRQPTAQQPPAENPLEAPAVQQIPGYVAASAKDIWILFGSYLWAAGFVVMVTYSVVSIVLLKRRLRESVRLEKGVYLAEKIDTPFVMGLLIPKIYLPVGLEGNEKEMILAHEKHHIRRLDPVWKALGFLALSIHWFNPLVWIAFICACRDMEMSCDEAVLKRLGESVRAEYAASLLKITTGRRIIAGSPLAFGEGNPKGRIRNLAKWGICLSPKHSFLLSHRLSP